MKRKMASLCVALTALTLISVSIAQPKANRPRQGRPMLDPASQRRGNAAERQVEQLRRQIAEVQAGHEALVADLKAIHAAAVEEKATGTAEKIEQLIAKRQAMHKNRMQRLERRQEALAKTAQELTDRLQRRGRRAPNFELNSFDGRNVSLSQYKGRVVVLEWFNMDCPFSKYHYETKSTMVDLAKKYQDKEVVWLAINSASATKPEANRSFAKKHKLPYPILDDRSGRVGRAYGARTTPHVFVIDKNGYIAYNGAIDSAPMGKAKEGVTAINYVDQALTAVTLGLKPSTPATPPYGCSVKYGR